MTISYYAGDDEYEYEYRHQRGQHARFEEPVIDLSHPPAYATAPTIDSWGIKSADLVEAVISHLTRHPFRLLPTEVARKMDEFNVRVLRLENAHKRLQEANDELTERNRRLEDRVASLIATRTQGRSDVATAEHSAHQTIAADYRALVEQRLHAFARAHHKASSRTGHYADRQRVPRFLAELTRALFADLSRPLPAGEGAWNALGIARTTWTESDPLALLRADCDNLRQRANKAGLQARWDFMILKDRPLNPERQEPWSSCDPNDPVRFVVAPGYMVDDQVYTLQYVYTSPDPIS